MGDRKVAKIKTAQHRLHLTAFPFAMLRGRFAVGAVRGSHLVEDTILCRLVQFKSAAGEQNRFSK